MLILSYNLSPTLQNQLKEIDKLRSQILLTPLSVPKNSQLTWSATLDHIQGWANLTNQPISHDSIVNILQNHRQGKTTPQMEKVLNYKAALDHLWLEWSGNPRPVTPKDVRHIAKLLDVNCKHENEITSLLGYIQTGNIHPVVQSAIVHLYFQPNRLAYLASVLFMYKSGYHLNRFLALEPFWAKDKLNYLARLKQAETLGQITMWLEYYSQAVIFQIAELKKNLTTPASPLIWKLTSRQKQILSLFDQPGTTITNRLIKNRFNVSQITASRDLSQLAKLGLLAKSGSGRSTLYTKI